MRFAWLLGGMSLTFALAVSRTTAAGGAPDIRPVIVPQAQVWCGPGTADGLYPTNLLRQGDPVQVEEELPSGWLAIRPPAGSYSYINKQFVQRITPRYPNYAVSFKGNPVPVLIGSSIGGSIRIDQRPTKIGARLPFGAQVRLIAGGREVTDSEGTWLPIEPPVGEVRYIRKEDVAKSAAPPPTTVAAGAVAATPRPAPAAPPPPPDGDALWREAEKAERTGHPDKAIQLYRLAGDANLALNRDRADEAYRRAHWLERANTSSNAPNGSYYYPDAPAPSAPPPAPPTGSAVRLIAPASSGQVNGQLVSTQVPAPGWGMQPGAGSVPTASGYLCPPQRTNIKTMTVYLLTNDKGGTPLMYVTAGPGVELMSFVNQNVDLWGTITYFNPLRSKLLTVSRVQKLP